MFCWHINEFALVCEFIDLVVGSLG